MGVLCWTVVDTATLTGMRGRAGMLWEGRCHRWPLVGLGGDAGDAADVDDGVGECSVGA